MSFTTTISKEYERTMRIIKYKTKQGYLSMVLANAFKAIDAIVFFITLGFIDLELQEWLLFSVKWIKD